MPTTGLQLRTMVLGLGARLSMTARVGFALVLAASILGCWRSNATLTANEFFESELLSDRDRDLLKRMGGVVTREYGESGYPITTEVLRISDEGIRAIGRFPAPGE